MLSLLGNSSKLRVDAAQLWSALRPAWRVWLLAAALAATSGWWSYDRNRRSERRAWIGQAGFCGVTWSITPAAGDSRRQLDRHLLVSASETVRWLSAQEDQSRGDQHYSVEACAGLVSLRSLKGS